MYVELPTTLWVRVFYARFSLWCVSPICVLEWVTGAGPVPVIWKTTILLLYDTHTLPPKWQLIEGRCAMHTVFLSRL